MPYYVESNFEPRGPGWHELDYARWCFDMHANADADVIN